MTSFATGKSGTIGRHLSNKVQPLVVQLEQPDFILELPEFKKNDHLIHLAGIVGTNLVDRNTILSQKVNVQATKSLAEYFLQNDSGRFIYISTSHIYKKSQNVLIESSPLEPISNYAKQKFEAENILLDLFHHDPARLCILRVFSVLDWEVPEFSLGGAIAKLADYNSEFNLANSEDIRDFLTPGKIASVIEEVANNEQIYGILNICSGVGKSIAQAAQEMLNIIGVRIPKNRFLPGHSAMPYIVGSNSKLLSMVPELDLEWKPSSRKL